MKPLDLNIDLSERPWPDDTSHVFVPGEPSRRVAWIPNSAAQWHCYAHGYKEAAERLYESWLSISDDNLIFPLVFLYRHYVELRLKELLQSSEQLLGLPQGWQSDHDIAKLWSHLESYLVEIFPDESEIDLQNSARLLRELAEGDPFSFHFRYPESKKGKEHLKDLERLDVVSFVDAIRKLSAFLDGASMAISVYQDNSNSI